MSSRASSISRRKRGSTASRTGTSGTSITKTSTGPYDRAYLQHLIDHGILPDLYEYPDGRIPPEPDNMRESSRSSPGVAVHDDILPELTIFLADVDHPTDTLRVATLGAVAGRVPFS